MEKDKEKELIELVVKHTVGYTAKILTERLDYINSLVDENTKLKLSNKELTIDVNQLTTNCEESDNYWKKSIIQVKGLTAELEVKGRHYDYKVKQLDSLENNYNNLNDTYRTLLASKIVLDVLYKDAIVDGKKAAKRIERLSIENKSLKVIKQ